jgi:ribonuclease G
MTSRREKPGPLRLLISTGSADRRVAVVGGDRLAELQILGSGETPLIGRISLGRLVKIDRGLEAAFVDCGGGQTGFLPLRDGPLGITEGQRLIVQVTREPFDGKSMRLTARPVLTGYRLCFTPFAKGPILPDGITDAEKQRLQRSLESLGDARRGVSPRSQAIGAGTALLRAEAESLRTQWVEIEHKATAAAAPMLLQPAPDPLLEMIRSHAATLEEICCDTRTAATQIAALCRSLDDTLAAKVIFRPRRDWVPPVAELEEQIDEALAGEAVLPSGAALHFAETRAMTVIDVDSGEARLEGVGAKAERSFLRVNLEAAQEIARQIRLRNLGGIIVVDFIDLRSRELRQQIVDALRAAVAGDPQPVWVGGMSRLGLVELTRQRRGPTLAARLLQDCAACGSRHQVPREDLRPWISRGI